MATAYVLYNKKAGNSDSFESVKTLEIIIEDEVKYIDVTEISNYRVFLSGLNENDYIILAGGDGTLNRFINNMDGIEINNEVLYFPNGTGNDFAHDLGYTKECNPFPITEHLHNLPSVTVKGKTYRFINGIGYGIDGYCCEVGDEQKAKSVKAVNYTAIAIKGLLFHYKPKNAVITVDGKEYSFRKVWLAPTMKGRYYGGGMMATPAQDRTAEDGKLSVMLFHGSSSLRTLMIFPSIFKGEHIKSEKFVTVLTGYDIKVTFDAPAPVQIDGETIKDVTEYTVTAKVPAKV